MKKFLSITLALVMVLAAVALVGCDKTLATVKFGVGIYNTAKATDASSDAKGQGNLATTVAAVLVDADGKIVACQIDTMDTTVEYTTDGKTTANTTLKTKYELGNDYNMKAWGGATKEWYEQADAFESVTVGKTLTEIKAFVAGDKVSDEVINAGCTIGIEDFVFAVEKAVKSATDSEATSESTLKLGITTEQVCKNATSDTNGENKLETTVFAAAVDADGKVIACATDCVQVSFTFDANGKSLYNSAKGVTTKKEAGADYGMKALGGATKEWYEQAAVFEKACVGKTADEIKALCANDNYGTADLKNAGCTILVNGFANAAAKIK